MALVIPEIQKLLSVEAPGYRFALANPQRNSYAPQSVASSLSVVSRSLYSRFDDRIRTSPRYLLCDNNLSLVVGQEELMVYDARGEEQVMHELHARGAACLGHEGYAWVTPSGQLSAADVNHDLQINRLSIPLFEESCATPLWLPHGEGFLAAVQNFGDPVRPEPPAKFYLYATTYEKSFWNWIVEIEGLVEDVFLTSDRSVAIVRQGAKFRLYHTGDGKLKNEFDTELGRIHATVVGADDELIMLASSAEDEESNALLLALDFNGNKLWSAEVSDAELQGFLAVGEDGFAVISTDRQLRAVKGGSELYISELQDSIGSRLTILKENQVLAVAGKSLEIISLEGTSRRLCDLGDYDDNLLTAPAVAPDGRVTIGTDRALIQLG